MEKIGFIGLGIMGKHMARNLLKAGFPLIAYNRSQSAVDELVREGAERRTSLSEVARDSTILITMLPDSPDVESMVMGEKGLSQGLTPGKLFIDMSTIAPSSALRIHQFLKEKGVDSLDAPVSGGDIGAKEGTLSIMVGGSKTAFDRALPLFQKMGKNMVHIGGPGTGQITKTCNQIVVAVTVQAVAEALNLAKKSGVDAAKVREALLGGYAQSRIMEVHGKRMLDGEFKPGFKIKLHRKDLNIALQTAKELSAPLFATAHVAATMDAMLARGKGELDNSALIQFLE